MKVSLITPPFTQINTPYPAIQQLGGFLLSQGYNPNLLDLSQKVIRRIFTREFLLELFEKHENIDREIYGIKNFFIEYVTLVTDFIAGKDNNLAYFIVSEPAFYNLVDENEFGADSLSFPNITDKAKYLSTKFIEEIYLFINKYENSRFGLSRYAEKLASSCSEFSIIEKELNNSGNLIDKLIEEETINHLKKHEPDIVGYSIPFPGNLLGALISARTLKKNYPETEIIFGGGYVNTELRNIKDKKFFEYVDYLTLDDGEIPLLRIIKNRENNERLFCRTYLMEEGEIKFCNNSDKKLSHNDLATPLVKDFHPEDYFSVIEINNIMNRLWTDGFWNKLTLAHGCYWSKCTFCDTSLDYIGRYSPARASKLVDQIEEMIAQNGVRSFHFTDEAAPPKVLKQLALELIKRNLKIIWWGNIRFEKAFDNNLCKLLRKSGCIAVTGGIEVADKRLLKLINKGVSIEDASVVCRNFREAGILVHAYLMYGFPTETIQETINSLELVRQFFKNGLFNSAYWHRFSLTVHSPIYFNQDKYNVKVISGDKNNFGNNDLKFVEKNGIDHGKFSFGLKKALYNYLHSNCLDWDVRKWFDFKVPVPTVNRNLIKRILENTNQSYKEYSTYLKDFNTVNLEKHGKESILILRNNLIEGEWQLDVDLAGKIYQNFISEEKFFEKSNLGIDPVFFETEDWKEISSNFLIGI